MELISVIVPVYNTGSMLRRCLDSIKSQTYDNLEVLIINDGSTDNTAEICEEYVTHDSRFNYIYQENAGVSAARNNGLAAANGRYVNFCDSDDWLEPTYIEELYNGMVETNSDIAICGYTITDGTTILQSMKPDRLQSMPTEEFARHFWEYHDGVFINIQTNKLFKKELIANDFVQGMTCGEDMYFNLGYMKATGSVATIPTSGYFYYKPISNVVKYPKNNADQCLMYSECVRDYLSAFLQEKEYLVDYQAFLCGNMCRDVFLIAQSKTNSEARKLINEFIEKPEFRQALSDDAWKKLDKKYCSIAWLLKKRFVNLIIVAAKVLKKAGV